jgi:hypothetical protein
MADVNFQPVKVNEADIARLTRLYQEAYTKIVSELTNSTGFGVARRKQLLAEIESILTSLGVDVEAYIAKAIPEYYKSGAKTAVEELREFGADFEVSSGFNKLHQEAIQALVSETQDSFLTSMDGVARDAKVLLGKSVRDMLTARMAEGVVTGKTLKEVQKTMIGGLEQKGLTALTDKGGKTWELDRYTEMLIRTKAVEARNRGVANRLAENGYDLVKVTTHYTDDPICAVWEGKILSLTGNTPGYPTVAEAEADGLFHPNCKHAINAYIPALNE